MFVPVRYVVVNGEKYRWLVGLNPRLLLPGKFVVASAALSLK